MRKLIYSASIICAVLISISTESNAQSKAYYDYLVPGVPEIYYENPDQPCGKAAADSVKKQAVLFKKSDKQLALATKKNSVKKNPKKEARKEK